MLFRNRRVACEDIILLASGISRQYAAVLYVLTIYGGYQHGTLSVCVHIVALQCVLADIRCLAVLLIVSLAMITIVTITITTIICHSSILEACNHKLRMKKR